MEERAAYNMRFCESGHRLVGQIVQKQRVLCLVASSVDARLRQAATTLAASVGRQCVKTTSDLHLRKRGKTCEAVRAGH